MTPLAAALALALSAAAAAPGTPSHAGGLPFVEDDYAAALSDARARGVPLVVDAWAPW